MDHSVLVRPRWLRGALRKGLYPYYWLTAPLRPLPSALIIGTMKGGTSTLNAWLRHHPQVMFSAIKEVHYFDECFERGERWYRTYFPLWEQWLGGRCSLEATPSYLYRAAVVIPRMQALLPEARLIVLLRNPVARAISHYGHQLQRGVEQRSAADALMGADPSGKGKPNHYKRRGLYAQQLEQVLQHYPREQLLVLRSEDFFAQPADSTPPCSVFLGSISSRCRPSPLLKMWAGLERRSLQRLGSTCRSTTANPTSACRPSCPTSLLGKAPSERHRAQRLKATPMRSSRASAFSAVTTNTSWALLPRRATSFQPPVIGVDTRNRSSGERPFTRAITAGVIVSMAGSCTSRFSSGMSPSR